MYQHSFEKTVAVCGLGKYHCGPGGGVGGRGDGVPLLAHGLIAEGGRCRSLACRNYCVQLGACSNYL